jgi:hypothetical protein
MKKSILFVAVAAIFALASCGGEKAPETTTVDTAAAMVDTTAAVDTAAAAVDTAAADTAK